MNKDAEHRKLLLAYTGLVMTVIFWSVNTALARGMVFTIKPMALSFFRWFFALVFIMPFTMGRIKEDWPVIKENWIFLSVLAFFSVAMYNSMIYLGAQYTTATNISLVIAAMPGMTLLLAWLINKEKTSVLQITGVGISLIGMLMVVSKGSLTILKSLAFNAGDLLIILAIFSWAVYSVLLRKRQIDLAPMTFLSVLITIGVACILPFYLWEYSVYRGFELNLKHLILFVFLGIFPSILSYICWNYGVKITGSATASVFMYLIPVFTSIIAFFFLGERLFAYHFIGGSMILVGLILSSRNRV